MRICKLALFALLFLSGCVVTPTHRPPSQRPGTMQGAGNSRQPGSAQRPGTAQRPGSAQSSGPQRQRPTHIRPSAGQARSKDPIARLRQRAGQDRQNAGLNYALASAYAKANDAKSCVQQLEELVRKNWVLGVDPRDFQGVQSNPQYRAVASRLGARQATVATGSAAASLSQKGFRAGGIVWDQSRNRFYLGDTSKPGLLTVQSNGITQPLRISGPGGLWAPQGMRIEPDGKTLWVATQASPAQGNSRSAAGGRSALVAIDLQSGRILGRFESGDAQNPSAFHDVQPLGDGRRAIVSDASRGTLFIASLGKNAMARMFPEQSFEGPRGMAYDPVSERLFVSDSAGLSVVDVESNRHKRLPSPAGEYLGGAGALDWWKGTLVGLQDGLGDLRVWSLQVSGDSLGKPKVLSSRDPRLASVNSATTNSKGIWLVANGQLFHIPL